MPPPASRNTARSHRRALTHNTKVWVFIGAVAIAVVGLTFDRNQYKALHATNTQIASEQAAIARLNAALSQESSGGATVLRTAAQEATKAEQLLPHGTPTTISIDQAKALTAITRQAHSDGLKLGSIGAPQSAAAPSGAAGWSVAVSVSGALGSIETWVGQIQSASPLESISNATLSSGGSGTTGQATYTMQATVNYWYTQTAPPALSPSGASPSSPGSIRTPTSPARILPIAPPGAATGPGPAPTPSRTTAVRRTRSTTSGHTKG